MRPGSDPLIASSVAAICAAIACNHQQSQDPSAADEEGNENATTENNVDNQSTRGPRKGPVGRHLPRQGKPHFENAACNTCMNDNASCCQATIRRGIEIAVGERRCAETIANRRKWILVTS